MTGPSGDQPYQPYSEQPKPFGEQPPTYGSQGPSYEQQPYGQQPSYGQQPYGQPPSYGAPQPPPPPYSGEGYPVSSGSAPLSTLSVVALITGIFCGLIGVIFGFLGLKETRNGAKRGRGLAIAGIVLGLLTTVGGIIIAIAIFAAGANFVDSLATNMEVGDCIEEIPTADEVYTLPKVDCSEPHTGEVFATVTVADADTYPGVDVMMSYEDQCASQIDVMTLPDDASLFLLYPTQDTWDAGDRTVVCVVTTDEPTTGSLR